MGKRINDMRLNGNPIEANKKYKVAGWALVAEEAKAAGGKMIWEVAEQWLKASGGKVSTRKASFPQLNSVLPNPGVVS